jgi:hypothetical protein
MRKRPQSAAVAPAAGKDSLPAATKQVSIRSDVREVGMAEQTAERVRTIVIPRELEAFFFDRLRERYQQRSDVEVIVDRRQTERRRPSPYRVSPGPLAERRRRERRDERPRWSLPEMPFAAS